MNRFKTISGSLFVVIAFFATSSSQEVPKNMLKVTTRVVEPSPEAASFAAQRKTCWRAGKKYARIAEAPDIENHIHGLTIVNEPDAWLVNLYDKTAKHIVDPGPSLDVHIPIFTVRRQAKSELEQLEFGEELQFFTKNHAKQSVGETFNGKATARFDLKINGFSLSLWTDVASKKPARISLVDGPQIQTIEYLFYEDNLQFDPKLFQPPDGIVIKDVK